MKNFFESASLNKKMIIAGVISTILLGVATNYIYDVLAKPSINWLGEIILNILSFASNKMRDLPYASASLNPYPLPSLILLGIVLTFFVFINIQLLFGSWYKASKNNTVNSFIQNKWFALFNTAYILLFCFMSIIAFVIVNQAIIVRRVYEANIDILSPYIDQIEKSQIQSQFTVMTTKAEHEKLRQELAEIAKKNNLSLRVEEP